MVITASGIRIPISLLMEFFVTCGAGMEPFALIELKEKFSIIPAEPQAHPGKIFFKTTPSSSSSSLVTPIELTAQLIKNLKTVERIFGVVSSTTKEAKNYQSGHELLNHLFKLSSGSEVTEALDAWGRVRTNAKFADGGEDGLPSPIKRPRQATTFRVNVKVSGEFRRLCDARRISKCVGSAIVKSSSGNWSIDLRRPQLELSVYVTDDGIILAVPLTLKPLSERSYLVHIPLRSTVAYAMGSLLRRHLESIRGDLDDGTPWLVHDPMCGTATILIELALSRNKRVQCVGMDISEEQVTRAVENLTKADLGHSVSLVVGDAGKRWPLKGEVDGIVCDLPFGQQHGTSEAEVRKNLPGILGEMDRALVTRGILVLLMSSALSPHLVALAGASPLDWKPLGKFPLKLGELLANIFVFQK